MIGKHCNFQSLMFYFIKSFNVNQISMIGKHFISNLWWFHVYHQISMVLKRLCASSKDNYYSQIPENGNSDPHMWDPAATLVWELAQDKARGSKDGTWKSPLWKAAKKHKWPAAYTMWDKSRLSHLRRLPMRLVETRRRIRTGFWSLFYIFCTPRRNCNINNTSLVARLRLQKCLRWASTVYT